MTGALVRERATLPVFLQLAFGVTWAVWVPRALESAGVLDSRWASGLGAGWADGPAIAAVLTAAGPAVRPCGSWAPG